ncbi:MAG: 30S ribosomal protein S3, partial [Bryobacteraceae bacterium]
VAAAPVAAAAEPAGPAVQAPPSDLPRPAARAVTPILPPLMSPQQPSWKQEARQESAPGATEGQPAETKPGENQ